MGNLLREYWMPILFSDELTADGRTMKVKLLGEDLVAFRDTSGRPGLIEARLSTSAATRTTTSAASTTAGCTT
jgi:hypothetical protein